MVGIIWLGIIFIAFLVMNFPKTRTLENYNKEDASYGASFINKINEVKQNNAEMALVAGLTSGGKSTLLSSIENNKRN